MSSADLDVPVPPSPPLPPDPPARTFLRWVCTSNPFYVISAGLFLLGLRLSFGNHAREIDTWALMGGLTGYTLLLAGAAFLLVRFAQEWNDLRTVLLLVVLMFLATSVTFDELLVMDPGRGAGFNLGGLAFAVLITEGVLRGIRLRLPALFRLPYYLTLALFFLYPVGLTRFLGDPHSEALMWGLWGFSPAAGLVFLTLLPAVRRGPEYLRDNGSPWPWPFYPWSLFVFLAVAVCGRAFLLCWSFHLIGGANSDQLVFGPHFLVPFGFAVAAVVLELGIVGRHRPTQWVALALPVALVLLAGVGHRSVTVYAEFLTHFTSRVGGTPLFVALAAAAVFYLVAWGREVPLASEGLTLTLIGFAVIGRGTLSLADVAEIRPTPLVAAVLLQGFVALWRRDGWRLLVGGAAGLGWLGTVVWRGYRGLREDVPGLDFLVVGLLLLPVALLVSFGKAGVLGRWLADRRSRRLRGRASPE